MRIEMQELSFAEVRKSDPQTDTTVFLSGGDGAGTLVIRVADPKRQALFFRRMAEALEKMSDEKSDVYNIIAKGDDFEIFPKD